MGSCRREGAILAISLIRARQDCYVGDTALLSEPGCTAWAVSLARSVLGQSSNSPSNPDTIMITN